MNGEAKNRICDQRGEKRVDQIAGQDPGQAASVVEVREKVALEINQVLKIAQIKPRIGLPQGRVATGASSAVRRASTARAPGAGGEQLRKELSDRTGRTSKYQAGFFPKGACSMSWFTAAGSSHSTTTERGIPRVCS